jgi:site-specific recombinase XerD
MLVLLGLVRFTGEISDPPIHISRRMSSCIEQSTDDDECCPPGVEPDTRWLFRVAGRTSTCYQQLMLAITRHQPDVDYSGATDDDHLVDLWIRGFESPHTRRAYTRDIAEFREHTGKPLSSVKLADLSAWPALSRGSPSSRARRLNSVKSLLSFACRAGYLQYNVGAAFRGPKIPNGLTERILPEADVTKMLASSRGRSRALVRLLYASGARVSEVIALDWRDIHPIDNNTAILTLHGKGGKTRHVLVDQGTINDIGPPGKSDSPVFLAVTGGRLSYRVAHYIVRSAARRAKLTQAVSPHWLRHCSASHALDRGASVALVQASLGHASVATTGKYLHARPKDGLSKYLPL